MGQRITTAREFPAWFDLKNYECIDDLDMKMLMQNIRSRALCLEESVSEEHIPKLLDELKDSFFSDTPVETETDDPFLDQRYIRRSEIYKPSRALVYLDLMYLEERYEQFFQDQGFDAHEANSLDIETLPKTLDEETYIRLFTPSFACVKETVEEERAQVPLVIDLTATDDQIINSVKRQLPKWRYILNVSPSDVAKKPRVDDEQKIRDYRVIPLLDLMVYEKLMNVSIKKSVLMVKVFPDGEYGEKEYFNTIKPFIEKLLNMRQL